MMGVDVTAVSGHCDRLADTGRTPASAGEELYWLTERFMPGLRSVVALSHFRLEGPVDRDVLTIALDVVRMRHPVLRTRFRAHDGELLREVLPAPIDLRIRSLPAGTGRCGAMEALCDKHFDLANADVMRAGLALADDGADLYIANHHIVVDGFAEGIIAEDLAEAYGHVLAGDVPPPVLRPRMPAVALTPERHDELTAYWRTVLDGVADLPHEEPRQSHRELLRDRVAELGFEVPADVALALRRQARSRAMSVVPLALIALGRALGEMSGGSDFCVGVPVSTRRPSQEAEVGCEMNMTPVRLGDPFDPAAVGGVWHSLIEAIRHADLPRPEIIACGPAADGGRMPLYQVIFAYQNWPRPVHQAGPVRLRSLPGCGYSPLAEMLVEFYDQAPDDLTGNVQVTAGGAWVGRLDEFVSLLGSHLARLATEGRA